jgi:CRP-like cAMP-binding protein
MKNLVQKVCSYLLELSRKQNSLLVQLDMSKEEMAREFNVTRPALSRVFIELEKLGIIAMQGRKVEIKNLKYLEDYTSFG